MVNRLEYELYTVPRCSGCESVKKFLDEKKIAYSVYNMREQTLEQKKNFSKICSYFGSKIKREVVHNNVIVPLLIIKKDGKLENFAQDLDKVTELVN